MTTVQQMIIVFFVCKSLTDKNRNLEALIYYPTLLPIDRSRKISFNIVLVLSSLLLQGCKFWTLPIGSETNMYVANSNVEILTTSESVVKR